MSKETDPFYYVGNVHRHALPPLKKETQSYPAIFKRPVSKKVEGGQSVSMGFPVCVPTEMMDADALCAFMNQADPVVPPPAWQPIETAPRDGSDVLLFYPLDEYLSAFEWPRTIIGHWREVNTDHNAEHGHWVWQGRAVRGYSDAYQPTHWMPLPALPVSDASISIRDKISTNQGDHQ